MDRANVGLFYLFFFFQAEDGIRDLTVTGVQTCALPIYAPANCSPRVREVARAPGGRIMTRPRQRGFLEATRDLLRKRGIHPGDIPGPRRPARVRTAADLLAILLHVVERPRVSHFLATLTWRHL